jgi:methyl-accepting chemotaxis protein
MTAILSHMRIGQRLFLTVPVLAIIVAFFGLRDINRIRTDLMKQHEAALRSVVEAATSTVKLYYGREQAGRLTHEQAMAHAKEALRAITYDGTSGYIFVQDFAGFTQLSRIPGIEGKFRLNAVDANGVHNVRAQIEAAKAGGGVTFYSTPPQGNRGVAPRMAVVLPFLPWQWAVGAGVYIDDVDQAFWHAARLEIAIASGALLLACAAILWIGRTVTRPMARITTNMQALARGNLDIAIPFANRRNEFGALAAALQVFKDNARAIGQLRDEQNAAKAQADAAEIRARVGAFLASLRAA